MLYKVMVFIFMVVVVNFIKLTDYVTGDSVIDKCCSL